MGEREKKNTVWERETERITQYGRDREGNTVWEGERETQASL